MKKLFVIAALALGVRDFRCLNGYGFRSKTK